MVDNKQIDRDTQKHKADVLRAKDIIPASKKESDKNTGLSAEKQNVAYNNISLGLEAAKNSRVEIPKFDLAEEIMAEQRKMVAIKRKAPGKSEPQKVEPQLGSVGHIVESELPMASEKEQIIAEIVARDIEKLYRDKCLRI